MKKRIATPKLLLLNLVTQFKLYPPSFLIFFYKTPYFNCILFLLLAENPLYDYSLPSDCKFCTYR